MKYAPEWLSIARKSWRGDIIAGITLWGLIVPEAIGYAGLAGAPPEAGLYTVIAAVSVYALFGSSRQLVASATSATAATTAGVVSAVSVDPGVAVGAVALMVGLAFAVSSVLRLDFVIRFISKPVNEGFIFGLATFVIVGQLFKVLGVKKPDGDVFYLLYKLPSLLGDANWTGTLVGLVALAGLFAMPKYAPKLPSGLVVLGAAIVISTALDLSGNYDVDTVGKLPSGLPTPSFPSLPASDWALVATASIGILLVGMSEALSVAKEVAQQNGYELNTRQDMMAIGVASAASGLFGGMVGAGSMSATSLNVSAGARTPISSLTAGGAAVLTALFLGPIFTNLPEAVLAALIIHAVAHHVAPRVIRRFRKYSVAEYRLALLALVGVLAFDALYGLLIAMLINLVYFVYRSTSASVYKVGPTSERPEALLRLSDHDECDVPDGVLILQPSDPLFYANVEVVGDQIRASIAAEGDDLETLILDLDDQHSVDLTSATQITEFVELQKKNGIDVHVTNVSKAVSDSLKVVGFEDPDMLTRTFGDLRQKLWPDTTS